MSTPPKVLQVIQSTYPMHPNADAVALHPDSLRRVKAYVEEAFNMVDLSSDEGHVETAKPEEGKEEGQTRLFGWPVLESKSIPEGEVRFVKYLNTPEVAG